MTIAITTITAIIILAIAPQFNPFLLFSSPELKAYKRLTLFSSRFSIVHSQSLNLDLNGPLRNLSNHLLHSNSALLDSAIEKVSESSKY